MKNAIKARVTTTPERGIMDIVNDVHLSPAAKQTILSSMMYSFFANTIKASGMKADISDICNLCQFVDIGVYVNAQDKDVALELLGKQIKQILISTREVSNIGSLSYDFDASVESFILQVRELLK